MSLLRISGILYQEYCVTKRSLEVIVDLFFFSLVSIVSFGLTTVFFEGQMRSEAALYLLLGLLLWEVVRVAQYSLSVSSMWNVWSRNLSNMFITPITTREFLIAQMVSGALKALIVFAAVCAVAAGLFNFDILALGTLNLVACFVNLLLFGWAVGVLILGAVFRFGQRIQALTWGAVFVFQPLCAAFFPVSILPKWASVVAFAFPPTYVFEAARAALTTDAFQTRFFAIATLLNIAYLFAGILGFLAFWKTSKAKGQFARLEA